MNYFITGTDTGVGKTLISCALLHAFATQGKKVVGMKPVAAGCDEDGLNEDVKKLRDASNILASLGQINPYSFVQPIAPHIASRNAGVQINLERILESYRELSGQADVVIVEGAGGFKIPLNEKHDSVDLVTSLNVPIILVVGMRLGCLNHALLTIDAIEAAGLHCAGWVANVLDKNMPALKENIEALKLRIHAPLLAEVTFQQQPDAKLTSTTLDLTLLETSLPDTAHL